MSSIAEIRHHIKSVEGTSKLTRAMHLISSAKMKKAMRMNEQNAQYVRRVRSDLRFILENIEGPIHNPYFRQHGNRTAYLVIAGDKGMCGGYNTEVLKLAQRTISESAHEQKKLFTIGHVASEHFERLGMNPDLNFLHVIQDPDLHNAREITSLLSGLFRDKTLDEVYVIHTQLDHMGQTHPVVRRMLPILSEDFMDAELFHQSTGTLSFHPSEGEVLDAVAYHYLVGLVYSILVQSYASEHSARMTAMDSATRNADEMLSKLKMELNHARQAAITQEISEIISGVSF